MAELFSQLLALKDSPAGKSVTAYLILCAVLAACLDVFNDRLKALEDADTKTQVFHAELGGEHDPMRPAVNRLKLRVRNTELKNNEQDVAIGRLQSDVQHLEER